MGPQSPNWNHSLNIVKIVEQEAQNIVWLETYRLLLLYVVMLPIFVE